MTALENILSQEIVQKLGWTLIHFVWQAAVVALILAVILRLLRKSSANLRYTIACLALTLMVLLPVMTIRTVNVSTAGTVTTQGLVTESAVDVTEGIPIAEMAAIPPQAESITASPSISWRQRAVSAIEPALPYIVAGWLLGVLGISVWHLGGWTQLQRLRRRMVKPVDASLHSKLRELAQTLGINRAIELAESALVGVPTVVGWLKPVILLPASALTGLSTEQLEAILAHELAHIKRGDYLVNILQTVVEILGFYHPAVWWVSHKIRVERENCCDDLAVSISGNRVRYARALTSMAEIRAGYGLAVAATGGSLFGRICRLVGKDTAANSRSSWAPSLIAIMLIMSLLISLSFAMSSRAKTDIESTAAKLDYSSVTVEEGVGFDDIIFGCTGEFIKSKLGEPDKEVHNEKDWWLNYRKTYGLGFWVNPQENFLIEIRLNKEFKGKLTSGISMTSTKEEVFNVYGKPIKEETVEDFDERFDNQVLLHRSGSLGRLKPDKIHYDKYGLLFWFDVDEIEQIVVYRKAKPDMQGKAEKAAEQAEDSKIRKHLSRLLNTDLPDSAGNLKYYKASFMTTDKFLARFDMPLRDLKNLLVKSDKLPVFPKLKDDPKIREKIKWYKHLDVDWWTPEDLSAAVFGHWEEGYLAPENKRVWIHNELQICCSEVEKGLMRVYIGSWSDGDIIIGKFIGSEPQKGSDNTKEPSFKPDMQVAVDAKAAIQVYARLLLVPVDANEFNNFFEDESLEVASININDDPNLKSYFLDDEQTQQLLKLSNTYHGSKTLVAPEVIVNDGQKAMLRTERKIRYKYTGPNAVSEQPKEKELPIGTTIRVKPTLQAGGEKILLELDFEHTNLLGFIDGLPQTEIVRIKTRVLVPNGSTLLLGGQKITNQQDGQEVLKTLFWSVKAEKL